jgi:hypothetical protein
MVPGVHALQSWSIDMYSRVRGYGHSYDIYFPWLVRGVLSSSPPGFIGLQLLADKARYERESSLLPREWECGEMCVMGWVNVWMRWVKTWWTTIKYGWTCIGNLQPYIGLLLYPCILLTKKHTQSIGWEPVASTNHTERYLVGFGCHLRWWQWRLKD